MLNEDFELDDDTRIIKHKHKSNFTMICNACINDKNLPADALAILVYVMSKPDDWKIIMKDISNRYRIGRDKTYNIINKLIELGYMKRISYRNLDGSLSKTSLFASDDPVFLSTDSCDKQPLPEIQEVVAVEKANKQPLPENPDTVNQEVDSLYTKKDVYKENDDDTKVYGNTIVEQGMGLSNIPTNQVYIPDSVVVFFMKKIEKTNISESTLVSWLRKHGVDYVSEKIRILESNGVVKNAGAFLTAAIGYDWKEKSETPTAATPKACNLTDYPTLDENRVWFRRLSDSEKEGLRQLALIKHNLFDQMLSHAKTSVLDEGFPDNFFFKMLMEFVGRAKR